MLSIYVEVGDYVCIHREQGWYDRYLWQLQGREISTCDNPCLPNDNEARNGTEWNLGQFILSEHATMAEQWSVADVTKYLESLELTSVVQRFKDNAVNGKGPSFVSTLPFQEYSCGRYRVR